MSEIINHQDESACAPEPVLSAVIPCYNEEDGLDELLRRVSASVSKCGLPSEILLVDDGSTDGTWRKMLELQKVYPNLCAVKLKRNHGHQLALSAGLSICHASQYVMVLDADLQDPPELLSEMLALMTAEEADVVYGQRKMREGESWFKLITAKWFYKVLRFLTDLDIPPDTGDFRLMKRHVVDTLNEMPEHSRFIRGMVSWVGGKQLPLLYNREARFAGKTKYPLGKMVRLAADAITSFSIAPLKIGLRIGALGLVIGAGIFIYCLYSYFFRETALGWTSIVATIVVMGSIQIFLLGLIGEYLARVFIESQHRPLFLIDKIINPK